MDVWVRDSRGRLLLVRRGGPPFKGKWALPGGFCEVGERTENCGVREVEEETGVKVRIVKLLGVYSDPKRDPRGHTVTVLYSARPMRGIAPRGGDDASEAKWFTRREVAKLDFAFDHGKIVREQLGRPSVRRRTR